MTRSHEAMPSSAAATVIWISVASVSSVLFSLSFACATPFATLAALSALSLRRGQALAVIGAAWFVNQAVGYGLLHYPRTPDSLAWGAVIGVAALAAVMAAAALRRVLPSPALVWIVGFSLAFATYEAVLFGATAFLPSGEGAFSIAIVGRVLLVNVTALVGLSLLHRAAGAVRHAWNVPQDVVRA